MLRIEALQPDGLSPVTLDVERGECLVVQGPSGGGKTLLLRAIADLDPCPGEALLDGESRTAMAGPEWRRRVRYVAADSGWWADRVAAHFADWTALVRQRGTLGLPAESGDWPVARLSTGERQRLALLRAVEHEPRVLLLDEPTSGLDAATRDLAEALLDTLRRSGVTLVWVTHDPDQAARVATRRMKLNEGQLEAA